MENKLILIQDESSIRAYQLDKVVLIKYDKGKKRWILIDNLNNEHVLMKGISAESILMASDRLFHINLDSIVNLDYLSEIKPKSVVLDGGLAGIIEVKSFPYNIQSLKDKFFIVKPVRLGRLK